MTCAKPQDIQAPLEQLSRLGSGSDVLDKALLLLPILQQDLGATELMARLWSLISPTVLELILLVHNPSQDPHFSPAPRTADLQS